MTGGKDIEDLVIYEAGIEIEQRDQVDRDDGQPIIVAQPDAQPLIVGQAFRAPVEFQAARKPTDWDKGLALCRNATNRYTNQIMARHRLMRKMPASNYPD